MSLPSWVESGTLWNVTGRVVAPQGGESITAAQAIAGLVAETVSLRRELAAMRLRAESAEAIARSHGAVVGAR